MSISNDEEALADWERALREQPSNLRNVRTITIADVSCPNWDCGEPLGTGQSGEWVCMTCDTHFIVSLERWSQ